MSSSTAKLDDGNMNIEEPGQIEDLLRILSSSYSPQWTSFCQYPSTEGV